MTVVTAEALAGARNMLEGCGGLTAGDRLLVVTEAGDQAHYWPCVRANVLTAAQELGLRVSSAEVDFAEAVDTPPREIADAMRNADLTVFLARMGDQVRFSPDLEGGRALVSYALDGKMLGSRFGRLPHAGILAIRNSVDAALAGASHIRVTCPAGSDFGGRVAGPKAPSDTTTIRFPLSVFTPIPADGFAGTIVQRGFLVGTGSAFYEPYGRAIDDALEIAFDGSRITGFAGAPRDVAAAEAHYDFVADRFGIDGRVIHSWHAGIHPGCEFDAPASENFERWSSGAFGNPRLLHAHTCGDYAPGEISLNLLDPTVTVDGVAIWEHGALRPERLAGGEAILAEYPELRAAYEDPAQACGEAPGGGLRFG